MGAIQTRPEDRFQTAGDFRDSLLEAGFGTKGVLRGVSGPNLPLPVTRPAISRETVVRASAPDVLDTASRTAPHKSAKTGYAVLGFGALLLVGIAATLFMLANNNGPSDPTDLPVAVASPTPEQTQNANATPKSTGTPRPGRARTNTSVEKDNSNVSSNTNSPAVAQSTPKPSPTPKKESIWKKPWKIFSRN